MTIEQRTDYEALAEARLTERYRKPNTTSLLKSWEEQNQALELALWDLLTKRSPATAEGAVLDQIGALVGQPREGRTDEAYRLWISARVLVNQSSGLTPELWGIVKKLVGDARVWVEDQPPAAVVVHVLDPIDAADGAEIAKLVALAKAGGVRLQFTWSRAGAAVFRFSQTGEPVLNSDYGFGRGAFSAVSDGSSDGGTDFEPLPEPGAGSGGAILVVL